MHADSIKYFLTQLETADNKSKAEIETMLVNVGSAAVPVLVEQLQTVKGAVRGVVAMTLIRIGEPSVDCLKKVAQNNKDFEWVAKYLISEIEGQVAAQIFIVETKIHNRKGMHKIGILFLYKNGKNFYAGVLNYHLGTKI